MIGHGPRNGFKVPGRTIDFIRKSVDNVSKVLSIGDQVKQLDIGKFLDKLTDWGITYEILEDDEMPHDGVEACCIPEELLICIRRDVFEKACMNDPRARFTVMHEFGHMMLGHRRTINRESPTVEIKTFEDAEWQADQFAAEFLMPFKMIKELQIKNVLQMQIQFNVSEPAAHRRINQLQKRGEL